MARMKTTAEMPRISDIEGKQGRVVCDRELCVLRRERRGPRKGECFRASDGGPPPPWRPTGAETG